MSLSRVTETLRTEHGLYLMLLGLFGMPGAVASLLV